MNENSTGGVTDHLGNEFDSIHQMCEHYEIPCSNYYSRIRIGWSVKDALTIPIGARRGEKKCIDHKGRQYSSIKKMCQEYGIHAKIFYSRIESGWTKEQALTIPVGKRRR